MSSKDHGGQKVSEKVRVPGFGHEPKDQADGRGWLGHEASDFREECDTYGDHEHMQTHREMHKDGTIHVGHEHAVGPNWERKDRSEFHQHVDPMEERFKHKERNAGVLLGARGGDSHEEWEGKDVHFARNKYMERGNSSGAKRTWKPKGREAAERASEDV